MCEYVNTMIVYYPCNRVTAELVRLAAGADIVVAHRARISGGGAGVALHADSASIGPVIVSGRRSAHVQRVSLLAGGLAGRGGVRIGRGVLLGVGARHGVGRWVRARHGHWHRRRVRHRRRRRHPAHPAWVASGTVARLAGEAVPSAVGAGLHVLVASVTREITEGAAVGAGGELHVVSHRTEDGATVRPWRRHAHHARHTLHSWHHIVHESLVN